MCLIVNYIKMNLRVVKVLAKLTTIKTASKIVLVMCSLVRNSKNVCLLQVGSRESKVVLCR